MSTYQKIIRIICKHVTVLNIIKSMRFIFCHYFHTNCSKFIKWPLKLYCIVLGVIIAYNAYTSPKSPHMFTVIEFILSLCLSLWTGDEYFYKYCRVVRTNDAIFGSHVSIFDNAIKLTMFVVFLLRAMVLLIFAMIQAKDYYFWCLNSALLVLNTNHLIILIIFLMIFIRMNYLRKRLERNTIPVNIIDKNSVVTKVREVRRCLIYYNNLLDNLLDISWELQCLIFMSMILSLPKFLFIGYVLINLRLHEVNIFTVAMLLDILERFLLVCSPAMVAEMIKSEVDKIKKTFGTQLLRCSDESLRFELEIALEYVTRRPFKFVVFRLIQIDFSVPISIVTLCITYVIVIIQFTHAV